MRNILPLLFILFTLLSCSGETDRSSGDAPDVGSDAPDVGSDAPDAGDGQNGIDHAAVIESAVFSDLEGNEVTLAEFEGKVLLIDFWETWCGPCLQVFPSLQTLREEYPDDFEVLAVTLGVVDSPEDARSFREEHGYDFHFLFDANQVSGELGIFSIPFKMYIGPDGKLIRHAVGSKGSEGDYEDAKSIITEYAK